MPAATPANLLQASLIAQGFFSKQQNVNTLTALQPGLLLAPAGAPAAAQRMGMVSGASSQVVHGASVASTAGPAPTTQLRLSPTASMLTQLTAQYREGLISETQKAAMKHSILRGTASRSPAGTVTNSLTLEPPGKPEVATAVPPAIAGGNVLYVRTSPPGGPRSKTSPTHDVFDPNQSLGDVNGSELSDFVNSAIWQGSPSNANGTASPVV